MIESYNVSAPVSTFCKPPGTSWSDRVSLYYGAHRWTCAWAAASSDRCYSGETLYGEVSITGSRDPSIFYYKVLKPARCV